jgi:hypothetical protein
MPRRCTHDLQEHRTCLRAAYESQEAKDSGVPQGLMFELPSGRLDFREAFYTWQRETEDAGTAYKCGRCHRTRFGAEDFQNQNEEQDLYNTQWAFIPTGRSVCLACSTKAKAKQAAKPKQPNPTPPPLAVSADPTHTALLQQMVELMQEQAERQRKRDKDMDERLLGLTQQMEELVQTNMEIAEENKTLREEVQMLTFEVQSIAVELESLNDTQDKVKTALETKAGVSFEEEEIFDAEKHDDTYVWDEGPGKYVDDEYETV